MTKLSIVMPSYNSDQYIARAIDSVLEQSFSDLEILIIDAGSQDETKRIALSYKDQRVIFLEMIGSKQGEARNYGIKKASGELIMFLDSDDYLSDQDCINDCLNFINSYDADFYNFSVRFCEGLSLIKTISVGEDRVEEGSENITKLGLNGAGIHTIPWNKIYRSSFLEHNKILFPKMKEQEDMVFVIHCCAKAQKVAFCSRDIVYAEVRSDSLSRSMSLENVLCCIEVFKQIEKLLTDLSLLTSCKNEFDNYVYRTSAYIMMMSTYRIANKQEFSEALSKIKGSKYFSQEIRLFKIKGLKLSTIVSIIALKYDLVLRTLRRFKRFKLIKGY